MLDTATTDSDLVAAFLAKGGQVTKCPTGKSALAIDYTYVEGKGLVMKDPAQLEQVKRRYARHGGQRKRETSPEVLELRRKLTLLMADGHGAAYCAKALGIHESTARNHARALDMTFDRPERPKPAPKQKPAPKVIAGPANMPPNLRRAKVARMVKAGKKGTEIAKALGCTLNAVHQDVHHLGYRLTPHGRRTADANREAVKAAFDGKRTPSQIAKVTGLSRCSVYRHLAALNLEAPASMNGTGDDKAAEIEARRDKVVEMVEQGMGGKEISIALGVAVSMVHHDCMRRGIKIPRGRRKPPSAERKAELALAAAVRALREAGMSAEQAAAAIKAAA